MKQDIHPSNYREVVFKDMSNDEIFITRSTVAAKETIEVDGVTYPLVKLEITSSSHPLLHRQAEARRYCRSCGQVHEPLRQPQEEISLASLKRAADARCSKTIIKSLTFGSGTFLMC